MMAKLEARLKALPDREPGVLYICGVSVPGLDYADYKAIEVDGHRFERVRECTPWSGMLTADDVLNAVYKHGARWQAIADELNAELGGGNCARCAEDMGRYADSLCDPLKERIAELLRCLENDWHIHASWDGLRKFWCIELTEEGVRLRDAAHGKLTAEQVSKAIYAHSIHAERDAVLKGPRGRR